MRTGMPLYLTLCYFTRRDFDLGNIFISEWDELSSCLALYISWTVWTLNLFSMDTAGILFVTRVLYLIYHNVPSFKRKSKSPRKKEWGNLWQTSCFVLCIRKIRINWTSMDFLLRKIIGSNIDPMPNSLTKL